MKKAILSIVLLLGLAIWFFANLYHSTLAEEFNWQQKASEIATKKANLQFISDVEFFHGKKSYQTVFGTNKNGEKVIVWIEEKKENPFVLIKKESDGWTSEMVREQIIKDRQPKKIQNIRLGIKDKQPIWEATYIDQDGRFTYYYLDFKTGTFLKRYSLTKDSKGDL